MKRHGILRRCDRMLLMATFFGHQYTRNNRVMFIVLLLCLHVGLHSCSKHKHAPVVAFFQDDCGHNICDQQCRDIDNGGYACECSNGYRLNNDGISCSKLSTDHVQNAKRPDILKVITLDSNIDTDSNKVLKHSNKLDTDSNVINKSVLSNFSSAHNYINQDSINYSKQSSKEVTFGNSVIKADSYVDSETGDVDVNSSPNSSNIITLETDSLRNSETAGNNENLQSLVPNPIPKYSMSGDTPAAAAATAAAEKCHEFSCLNNGKCVDDGTVYRNKVRCDCELGTLGLRCDKDVDVRYPRFYGNSYLALPVLKGGDKEVDILLEFKTTAQFGLLVFSSEFEDARSDFFSVVLIDGYIEFRYDCGTGMGVVRSVGLVAMDTWNTVRVHRQDNLATLWLNDEQPVRGSSQGSYSRLTLRLYLYLGGYGNMASIKDKVGTTKGFVGCVQQVNVNDYKFDLRKAELIGDAQFGVNVGECSEGLCDSVICQNRGNCHVTSAHSHICLCPLGTTGESCQHVVDVHIPEFQIHSYLAFQGLGRTALLFLEIELVFKATTGDGLILYNGYTLDRMGDFISLALHGGYLEFRFDLGTGPAIIRSVERISLNRWHRVRLSRTGMEGILQIDDQLVTIGQSFGAFTQLTLTQDMYIGGHRNFDETAKVANVSHAFNGCIQKLTINNHPVDLIHDALSGVNIKSCEHPCVGQPCLNSGECVPKKDIYSCYCHLGYSGKHCEKNIGKAIAAPRFSRESYVMYTQKVVTKRIHGDKIDVRMSVKPESRNGLLLWSGPSIMQSTSDYIALGFKDGALQFRYNLGSGEAVISYNNSELFDGLWHYIHAQRDKQNGYLSIDGRDIVEGSAKGSYTMLNTNKILYIGGLPDVSQGTLRKFTAGYVGCIQDLVLDNDFSLSLVQSADNGRNIDACL